MKKSEHINNLKTYFTFSKGERNGIIFLIGVLALIIVAIKLIPETIPKEDPNSFIQLQKQVDSLFAKNDTLQNVPHKLYQHTSDPDTKKIIEKKEILLNSCDSAMLTQLPGIGPVLASRILKYRNLLGGYYSINQLKEVYGLKDENFDKAKSLIIIDLGNIKKLSVDTAGFKTLVRHPYIGKEIAWKIINLRKKLGGEFIREEYFDQYQICDSAHWSKLEPYIFCKKMPLQNK